MHSRNMPASAVQRLMTIIAIKCNADNKFLTRMNKLHVTQSAESKRTLMKEMAEYNSEKIIKAVSDGLDGKLNGDNVDIFVHTNDTRMSNHHHDYHCFATDWTPFRLTDKDVDNNEYLKQRMDVENAEGSCYSVIKPTATEIESVKESMKIIVGRILSQYCKSFSWVKLVNPLSDIMARKTDSYQMPVLLKNEAKYDDCIQILDAYIQQTKDWYNKAGRGDELKSLKIPVGGDQLTRVRLDGAKSLRAGAFTADDRLENLYPVIVELFHTVMDFVEKMFKTFMKKESGREAGTLANLKILVMRAGVNGKVKSRFKTHEDFLCLSGRGYLLEAALSYFDMETLESPPRKHCPPENIDHLHIKNRKAAFENVIGGFIEELVGPCNFEEEEENRKVFLTIGNDGVVECPISKDNKVALGIETASNKYQLEFPVKQVDNGKTIMVVVPGKEQIVIKKADEDDNYNYASYFTKMFLVLRCMKDAISEGDIFRVNCILKFMIPFFYAHSSLSKYFVECIDYIIKTEVLLPPMLALQVQTASFVNPRGGAGNNMPADMQKEHQVKEIKELIKSLGANKTENSILTISKAAPSITDIVQKFDKQCSVKAFHTNHVPRSDKEDLNLISKELRRLRLW